jgi:hypothetical protein
MAQDTPESQLAPVEGDWLLAPDTPPGTRVVISSVVEADQLSTEAIRLLGQAMSELQEAARSEIPKSPKCPKLRSCDSFRGGCPNLTHCGTYAPPGTPTI